MKNKVLPLCAEVLTETNLTGLRLDTRCISLHLQFIWKSGHCFLYSCSRCKNVVFVKPKLVVSPHLEVGLSKIRGHEPLLLVLGGNNQGCSCVGRSAKAQQKKP